MTVFCGVVLREGGEGWSERRCGKGDVGKEVRMYVCGVGMCGRVGVG
jgi:hypothetical protein